MRPKTALATSSQQVPGPGTYRIESSVGRDAPSASISGRFDLTTDSFQPGPGAYDLKSVGEVGHDAPAFTMAARPTQPSSTAAQTPGPGQYSVAVQSTAPAITMQGRHERAEVADTWKVGPGAYDVVSVRESPAYSMSGRHATKSAADVPGPGHYTMQSDMGKAPAASLSGRHEMKEDNTAPGPGTYQATYGATKQSTTRCNTQTSSAAPAPPTLGVCVLTCGCVVCRVCGMAAMCSCSLVHHASQDCAGHFLAAGARAWHLPHRVVGRPRRTLSLHLRPLRPHHRLLPARTRRLRPQERGRGRTRRTRIHHGCPPHTAIQHSCPDARAWTVQRRRAVHSACHHHAGQARAGRGGGHVEGGPRRLRRGVCEGEPCVQHERASRHQECGGRAGAWPLHDAVGHGQGAGRLPVRQTRDEGGQHGAGAGHVPGHVRSHQAEYDTLQHTDLVRCTCSAHPRCLCADLWVCRVSCVWHGCDV